MYWNTYILPPRGNSKNMSYTHELNSLHTAARILSLFVQKGHTTWTYK